VGAVLIWAQAQKGARSPPRGCLGSRGDRALRASERDAGQCTYVDGHGRRCSARTLLEYHHIEPYALGGPSTFENVCLRCATHNQLEAEEQFGASFMAQKRLFA